ncbi:MAG: DNA polymerase III subunit beta [Pelotomaculum sp. PtaB.Bin104]|nr:MAG: DNA polymerase III subunit beta [Pelotomaculum sp. PtaB.Bin104]
MNLISSKDDLLFAVLTVQRAVAQKSPLPILSGIKFKAEADQLFVTATDLEIGIQCSVKAEIIEDGSAVLPSKYITELIRRLPDVPIFIKSDPFKGNVTVKYSHSETIINGFPVDEFPNFILPAGNITLNIPEDIFKEAVKKVVFAVGTDENRPIFTGVLLEINDGQMQLAATDTHRLAWQKLNIANIDETEIKIVIPGKTLNELSKIIGRPEKFVKITLTSNQVLFTTEDVSLISRLISGEYPHFRQVIPQEPLSRVRLKTKDLIAAAERADLLNPEGSSVIKMQVQDNVLVVSVNAVAGRAYEEMSVFQEGEPVQVAFNARYLVEMLKVTGSEEIDIEFTGPLSPGVIKPVGEAGYLSLLLPVRIREE